MSTSTPNLTLCTAADLADSSFFIPSFQRGYRWKKLQVEQLLGDLWEFYQSRGDDPDSWYCLQPLVVAKNEQPPSGAKPECGIILPLNTSVGSFGGTWTVIDGQQRLTTLYLILVELQVKKNSETTETIRKFSKFGLSYERGAASRGFLDKPFLEKDEEWKNNPDINNPDTWHIWKASAAIQEWLNGKNDEDKKNFIQCIQNHVKFIWYETKENPYDVFIRLNSGKISLSNAELIKALLLRDQGAISVELSGEAELRQIEMAGEWDRIEQALHNDDFWYFINPAANSTRFEATRIDFILELVLRQSMDKSEDKTNYITEQRKNPYFGFSEFMKERTKIKGESGNKGATWANVQSTFRRIKGWYDNRSLYHYVGFLMNRKGESEEDRFSELLLLLKYPAEENDSASQSHSAFLNTLKNKCGNALKKKGKELALGTLEYNNNDKDKLNDVLLLFNLALLERQTSELSRYPFKEHTEAAWSLEHIHAQNERTLTEKDVIELSNELGIEGDEIRIDTLNEMLEDAYGDGVVQITTRQSNSDAIEDKPTWVLRCKEQEVHGLGNLALLDRRYNSKLSNKLYPEKRRIMALWEKRKQVKSKKESDSIAFIPLGTKMAFFKHFTTRKSAPFVWSREDSEEYFDTIVKLVADYVGLDEESLKRNDK